MTKAEDNLYVNSEVKDFALVILMKMKNLLMIPDEIPHNSRWDVRWEQP